MQVASKLATLIVRMTTFMTNLFSQIEVRCTLKLLTQELKIEPFALLQFSSKCTNNLFSA
jgi:hypothetical protein